MEVNKKEEFILAAFEALNQHADVYPRDPDGAFFLLADVGVAEFIDFISTLYSQVCEMNTRSEEGDGL